MVTSANSMHGAEHPKPVLWDNPRGTGWRGRWEGVQDLRDMGIPVANSF